MNTLKRYVYKMTGYHQGEVDESLTMFDNMGPLFPTIRIYILPPRNTFVIYTLFESAVLNFYQFTNLRSKKNKHHIM